MWTLKKRKNNVYFYRHSALLDQTWWSWTLFLIFGKLVLWKFLDCLCATLTATTIETGMVTWGDSLHKKLPTPTSLPKYYWILNSVYLSSQAHNASWSHGKHARPYCPEPTLANLPPPTFHECCTNVSSIVPPQKEQLPRNLWVSFLYDLCCTWWLCIPYMKSSTGQISSKAKHHREVT